MSGAHVAVHAAAEAARQLELEETEMTNYTDRELAGEWEFKILRSATGKFNNPQVLAQVVEEEAIAGWIMLEKFDEKRIRFKRPMSARRKDTMLPAGIDPYRTNYGMSNDALGATIGLSILGGVALFIGILAYFGLLN